MQSFPAQTEAEVAEVWQSPFLSFTLTLALLLLPLLTASPPPPPLFFNILGQSSLCTAALSTELLEPFFTISGPKKDTFTLSWLSSQAWMPCFNWLWHSFIKTKVWQISQLIVGPLRINPVDAVQVIKLMQYSVRLQQMWCLQITVETEPSRFCTRCTHNVLWHHQEKQS